MKNTITKLGTDKNGTIWNVEVQEDKVLSLYLAKFMPWCFGVKPSLRNTQPTEIAVLNLESKTRAKLNDIEIDEHLENRNLGSLLIDYVEKWASHKGIIDLYGDIVQKDSGHLDKLQHFYTKNGWTFELCSIDNIRPLSPSSNVGKVWKKITKTN